MVTKMGTKTPVSECRWSLRHSGSWARLLKAGGSKGGPAHPFIGHAPELGDCIPTLILMNNSVGKDEDHIKTLLYRIIGCPELTVIRSNRQSF